MNAILRKAALLMSLQVTALGALAAGQNKGNSKPSAPAPAPTELVWPGPPEQPRIRFIAAITTFEDVTGRRRLSFAERMAGKSPMRERLALKKPYGVAVDRLARVFVADAAQKAIVIFDRNTKSATLWKGNGQFPLALPVALAFSDDGRLFVSDSFAGQIVVFEPTGKPIAAFGKSTLGRPGGLAVDSARKRLYVADAKFNQVSVFSTENYSSQQTIGRAAKPTDLGAGALSGPSNVALDSKGNLFVTDTFNCRIQVFDPAGSVLRVFGTQGVRPGNFVRPKGIALDSEDHVYVVDAAFNNLQVFTTEGKPLLVVGSGGDQPGQFMLPAGLATDREDRVYVTEQRILDGRLQVFQYLREPSSKP